MGAEDLEDSRDSSSTRFLEDSEDTQSSHCGHERTNPTRTTWSALPHWLRGAFGYRKLDGADDYADEAEEDPDLETSLHLQSLRRRLGHQHRRSLWTWRALACLLTLLLALREAQHRSGIFKRPGGSTDITSPTVHDVHMRCGDDTRSALARGCRYHPLSNGWLPARCRVDRAEAVIATALNLDAGEKQPFKIWLDPAGREEVTDWTKLNLGQLAWTTEGHHIAHCLSTIVQMAAVGNFGDTEGDMAEEAARDWAHVEYCAQTILTAASGLEGWDQINSFFAVGSSACW